MRKVAFESGHFFTAVETLIVESTQTSCAKIAKVCHLGGSWVGGLGGLNMAQQSHRLILVDIHL